MAVAVERVCNQVEWSEGDEGIEGTWRDAADLVGVEGEGVKVDQAVEQLLVHFGNGVLGKRAEKNKHNFYSPLLMHVTSFNRNYLLIQTLSFLQLIFSDRVFMKEWMVEKLVKVIFVTIQNYFNLFS